MFRGPPSPSKSRHSVSPREAEAQVAAEHQLNAGSTESLTVDVIALMQLCSPAIDASGRKEMTCTRMLSAL